MIGKVIEGRYIGSGIFKLPDKNVLVIRTEDGNNVALPRSNVISIADVTDQYSSFGSKVMMVMWKDFETSIIQIGTTSESHEKKHSNKIHDNSNGAGNEPQYLGSTIVSKDEIDRLKEIVSDKESVDALIFLRETYGLSAADALRIIENLETPDFRKTDTSFNKPNDGNSISETKKSETPNNTSPKRGMGCFTWLIILVLLGSLLNMCDGRTETEKWEDSYKGAYREYAEFYGWHQD